MHNMSAMDEHILRNDADHTHDNGHTTHGDENARASTDQSCDVGVLNQQVHTTWMKDLGRDERAAILAWGSFTATFALVRGLTHWLKAGHGPSSGGISVGGQHFHHYNLGIAGLTALGGLVVRAEARERIGEHPALPMAYGISTALIVDEAALLLDLKDVYWAKQGRTSVDIAIGAIGSGGFLIALLPLANKLRARRRR